MANFSNVLTFLASVQATKTNMPSKVGANEGQKNAPLTNPIAIALSDHERSVNCHSYNDNNLTCQGCAIAVSH